MTEAKAENKPTTTSASSKLAHPAVASSSLSSVAIASIQLINCSTDVKALLATSAPLFVTALVYFVHWLLVCYEIKPIGVMRTEKALASSIKQLREDIDIESKAGRDVKELEATLQRNLVARSKLFESEINS